jgi:uncharacterized YigZ family protein
VKLITAYQTISIAAEGIYTESGSKFIGYVYSLTDEVALKSIKDKLKKEHHKAVHIAWAIRLGLEADIERSSDDGEPAGSAGKPILNELKSRNITNTAVLVVRYYGGKKLGIPGLINAYGTAAATGLKNAGIITIPIQDCYQISCLEADMHMVIHEINKAGAKILTSSFAETCIFTIAFNRAQHEKVLGKLQSIWQIELAYSHSL